MYEELNLGDIKDLIRFGTYWQDERSDDDYPERAALVGFDRWLAEHDAEVIKKALWDAAEAMEAAPGREPGRKYVLSEAGWLRERAAEMGWSKSVI